MSEYSKKTCYDCGIRKPQPEMRRVTETKINHSHGYSHKTKKTTTSRAYSNSRKVFVCQPCAQKRTDSSNSNLGFLILVVCVVAFLLWI